jgi:transposase
MSPGPDLPDDVDALKSLVVSQRDEIHRLEHNVRLLTQTLFGRSSEKRTPAPETPSIQGHLFLQEIAAEAARLSEQYKKTAATVSVAAHERKKNGRRTEFPAHLPLVRTVCELKDDERTCACGGELKEFGEETARELERVETTVVHEIARKKYACAKCGQGVVTAPWRGRVIEKGLLGPGFLSHVITERFGNHMPYYRLEGKYKSEGLDLARSVLCESTARSAELLSPIVDVLRDEVVSSGLIHTDDTPVTLAQSTAGGSREARVWVYLDRAGNHWYDFTESRKRDGPARVLKDFRGYIHADAYAGYDRLFLPGGAIEVACWAHVRRKFIEAEPVEAELSRAAVDRIRVLFQIEEAAAGLTDEERRTLREAQARPLLEEFRAWMDLAETQTLPKGPLAKAIGYAKNQWTALMRYLDDGRLSISNNAAENALRPLAVGRKNWLFFQRDGGGRTAAILMSLLMTAKAAGVNPGDYFKDVLLRISEPGVDARDLTPHRWKTLFEAEVAARRHDILKKLAVAP